MADTTEQPEAQEPGKVPAQESANAESESKTVPYSRFQEKVSEFNTIKEELEALKAAETKRQAESEAAKKKQLEDQQKFKELYEAAEAEKATATESVTSLTAKVEAMEAALVAQWDSQKELVPEIFLPLVEAMPIEERIAWMSANSEKLGKEAQKGNGTPRRVTQKSITPPQAQQNGWVPSRSAFKI